MSLLDPRTVPLGGTRLIEASAGTGKTYTIVMLLLRLVVERRIPIDQILVVTFTRAATAELKERVRRGLLRALAVIDTGSSDDWTLQEYIAGLADKADARVLLLTALRGVDAAAVFTIHGFCQRMLQEYAFESGARFDVDLVSDERALVSQVLHDYWAHAVAQLPAPLVRQLMASRTQPRSLQRLADVAVSNPQLTFLPAAPEAPFDHTGALAALERWREAAERLADPWWAHRDEVVALLVDSTSLDRRQYPRKSVERWARDMDRLLQHPEVVPTALFRSFRKFTEDGLREGSAAGEVVPTHPVFTFATELERAHVDCVPPIASWLTDFKRRLVGYVRAAALAEKTRSRTQTYGDLLYGLAAALEHPHQGDRLARRVRARYPAALIDEFQDTDPVQYSIFRRTHDHPDATLFLIGDPKQAIYGFRGADVFAYLRAADGARGRTYTLDQNWRSDPPLIAAVNRLFRQHSAPFVYADIQFKSVLAAPRNDAVQFDDPSGEAARLQLCFVPRHKDRLEYRGTTLGWVWTQRHYPVLVASEIVRLLESGAALGGRPLQPGDLAVLVLTNQQARAMHAALQRMQVPAALQGDASVLESEEAGDMASLVAALVDPTNGSALRRALVTRPLGLDGGDLADLERDEAQWGMWTERFGRWHRLWHARGFLQAFRSLLDETDAPARILAQVGGERAVTNFAHLGELLQDAATREQLGPRGLRRWFARARRVGVADLGDRASQLRLETDGGAVQVVTVHRSKGLEYPVVFCPYLGTGRLLLDEDLQHVRFHAPDQGHRLQLDLGTDRRDRHRRIALREALAEKMRLLYVALTRARHRCVVLWGAFRSHETSALAYLLHGNGLPSGDPVDALRERLEAMGDAALLADLHALRHASAGAIGVCELPAVPSRPYRSGSKPQGEMRARAFTRGSVEWRRPSSYSALVSAGAPSRDPREGFDRDGGSAHHGPALDDPGVPVRLASFPRGAAAGTCLHAILEQVDFAASDAELAEVSSGVLARHGYDPAAWGRAVGGALASVLATPLQQSSPPLRDIPRSERIDEMPFVLPVRLVDGDSLQPRDLAAPFALHGAAPALEAYAPRVASLAFEPLRGFLRGFVDLVYRHDGRWYIVDYKSNHLGDTSGGYRAENLQRSMVEHHYLLQYHLYCVALHRHLTVRQPSYDYDAHFGGVQYLFLRGMAPEHGAGHGVFADRPPRALIEALSAVLTPPGAEVQR